MQRLNDTVTLQNGNCHTVRLKLNFHSFRSQIGLRFFDLLQNKTENLSITSCCQGRSFKVEGHCGLSTKATIVIHQPNLSL